MTTTEILDAMLSARGINEAINEGPGTQSEDRSDYVKVAAAFVMTTSLLMLLLRAMSRWPWKKLFGVDDVLAVVATAISIAQGIVVFQAADHGLGVRGKQPISRVILCQKLIYASNLIFIFAIYMSKLSTAFSLSRLSNLSSPRQRKWTKIIMGLCAVCFVVSIVIVGARATPISDVNSKYTHSAVDATLARWIVYTTLSGFMDLCFAAYPSYLVYGLQMSRKSKFKVAFSFGIRFLVIPITILRVISLVSAAHKESFLYDYAYTEIYTQVEMGVTMIATTVPCLRPFLVLAQSGLFDLERVSTWNSQPENGMELKNNPQSRAVPRPRAQPIPLMTPASAGNSTLRGANGSTPRGPVPRSTPLIPSGSGSVPRSIPLIPSGSAPRSTPLNPTGPRPKSNPIIPEDIIPRSTPLMSEESTPIPRGPPRIPRGPVPRAPKNATPGAMPRAPPPVRAQDSPTPFDDPQGGPAQGRSHTISMASLHQQEDDGYTREDAAPGTIEVRKKVEISRSPIRRRPEPEDHV